MGGNDNHIERQKRFALCFKLAKGLPVVLVCSLILYSYYCYVIQLSFRK